MTSLLAFLRNTISKCLNCPLGDDALCACHRVHHERSGEHGLLEVKFVAERVVALSCTDVTHDDGP